MGFSNGITRAKTQYRSAAASFLAADDVDHSFQVAFPPRCDGLQIPLEKRTSEKPINDCGSVVCQQAVGQKNWLRGDRIGSCDHGAPRKVIKTIELRCYSISTFDE